jgi:hypothetical protein
LIWLKRTPNGKSTRIMPLCIQKACLGPLMYTQTNLYLKGDSIWQVNSYRWCFLSLSV